MKLSTFITVSFLTLISCSKKEEQKKLSRDNELRLDIFGRADQDRFSVFYNITDNSKDTLFISATKYENEKDYFETNKIRLNERETDTLFYYFQKINEDFKIDEGSQALDGTNVRITITNSGNMASYVYTGLSKAGDASPHINNLVNFINKRLSEGKKIY